MVSSSASTVTEYLASLPPDRRSVVEAVRDVVNKNLPAGYVEGVHFGMIGWCVPLSRFADTYNGQPLGIVSLSSQKNYLSIYLMAVYGDPVLAGEFEAAWARAGKTLDMGKSCVRFKRVDDLALDVLADVLRKIDPDEYVARYQAIRGSARQQRAAKGGEGARARAKAAANPGEPAGEEAAKKSTEAGMKKSAKKATKSAAKKSAAKKSTTSAATKTTKPAAKKTAKKAAKTAAKKSTKTAAKKTAKKSTKTAAKKTAKKSTKTAAKKTAKKSTKTATKKTAKKSTPR